MTEEEDKTFKILLLTAEFPPQIGGIATLTSQVARELHGKKRGDKNIRVHVVTSVGKREGYDFPVTRTPDFLNLKYLKILPLLFATVYACLKDRPDRILLGKWTHEAFVGFLLKKVFRIPYLTFVHGSEILKFSGGGIKTSVVKKLLNESEKVIAVSSYTKGLVANVGLAEQKVKVVNNALNLDSYDRTASGAYWDEKLALEGKTVLLTVSRLVRRKGHDVVFDTLYDLVADHPDIVYLIAGDGAYRAELENKVEDLGLDEFVRFLGFVDGDSLDQLFAAGDVFIMPNRVEVGEGDVEGFGLSFLEANLFGLPVIAGESGGTVDAVVDEETGFLVEPTSKSEIKEKLVKLIEDEKLRNKLGRQGRERVLDQFNSARQAEEILELLIG